jgi:hypothetical protein
MMPRPPLTVSRISAIPDAKTSVEAAPKWTSIPDGNEVAMGDVASLTIGSEPQWYSFSILS